MGEAGGLEGFAEVVLSPTVKEGQGEGGLADIVKGKESETEEAA